MPQVVEAERVLVGREGSLNGGLEIAAHEQPVPDRPAVAGATPVGAAGGREDERVGIGPDLVEVSRDHVHEEQRQRYDAPRAVCLGVAELQVPVRVFERASDRQAARIEVDVALPQRP